MFDLTTERKDGTPISRAYQADCMAFMRGVPDKFFQLAIVDPPYGLNMAKERPRKDGRFAHNKPRKWDEKIPDDSYFKELFRISENQIIWGGNYFIEHLTNTQHFIFWYKQNPVENFSDGEFAWTSFNRPAKCFNYRYFGNIEGGGSAAKKIHISQKPVALYTWLLQNYTSPDDRVFDSHLGSGNSRIAAFKLGFDLWATEIDAEYFDAQERRFKQAIAEPLFDRVKNDVVQANWFDALDGK